MPCVFLCFFVCIHLCYLPVPVCSRLKVIHHQHPYHCFPHFTSPFPISPLPCPHMYLIAVYPLSFTPTFLLLTPPQQLHSLGREHGKTKASHQKLLSESQERETQLTQVAEARERLLMERQNVAQAHHVQQTRMQATIAQQSKLIDYLQGTPNSRLKIKKVLAVFPASHTHGFHKQ